MSMKKTDTAATRSAVPSTPPGPAFIARSRRGSAFLPGFFLSGLFVVLTACSSTPPEIFPKADYSYLPPLNLNVANIAINDQAPAQPGSLEAKAPPLPPDQNLALMARQRLHATGSSGQGTFTINQASLQQGPGDDVYSGIYSVTLTLDDPITHHHGQITARVTHRTEAAPDTTQDHNLYVLNQALMDDMNVELEFQVRKNLASWLTDATGAPLSGTVQSQNLDSPTLAPLNSDAAALTPSSSTSTTPTPNLYNGQSSGNLDSSTAGLDGGSGADNGMGSADDALAAPVAPRLHSPPPHALQAPY
ncbi:hypothetical protein E3203_00315 [Oecophyllibacter saccharovorans]|nr:hypothetical protein E3203_00315 [Oecophyllibacter saccharovorans]